ncbi:MAG: FAD:protein FMN transferase [Clostridium sp.]|nr:FAD:protein FMN transferase [Clostridium sp.]
MKKILKNTILLFSLMFLAFGCSQEEASYTKYNKMFFEHFDTVTTVIGYTKTQEEFDNYVDEIETLFGEYHKLYDIYNTYDGINNIKTINEMAGKEPVEVDQRIIDLLLVSRELREKTNDTVNIAMGPVLRIWSDYREDGLEDPENAKLPSMEELEEAYTHTDLNKVIIDETNNTVFLEDEKMSLDVGAIAKGYTAEVVGEKMRDEGFTSLILNAGGNIKVLDKPLDDRNRWGMGIKNPDESKSGDLDVVFGNNISVVTSGDYERYYTVDDISYHHLIDPVTLFPGTKFKSVTIVTEDSGVADYLSSILFLSDIEEGKRVLKNFEDSYALWVTKDNEIVVSDGFEKYLKSKGVSGADK